MASPTDGLVKLAGSGFGLHTVDHDGHFDAIYVPPDWIRRAGWVPSGEAAAAQRRAVAHALGMIEDTSGRVPRFSVAEVLRSLAALEADQQTEGPSDG